MDDFNMTPNNPKLSELIADHELCTLISEPTCFKSINPTCIDNFFTNKKTCFMKTLTLKRRDKFRGSRGGCAPSLFFANTLKNYKLCYLKLN